MTPYNPNNWYWIIGGDTSKAWSSAARAYVTEWPSDRVTRIASEAELIAVLKRAYPAGAPTDADAVIAERERRLALGFDYDFGDKRGVHRIGTTEEDLKGWDEVSKIAQAAINLGAPSTEIAIVTDSGPVSVTALEWQMILAAAGAHRQPIWAASFVLQAMDPIPSDYTSDGYWE